MTYAINGSSVYYKIIHICQMVQFKINYEIWNILKSTSYTL